MTLRTARQQDAAALLAIYAPYVRRTAVSFEYAVPTAEEFSARIRRTLCRYPYLAAWAAGEIVGYAYAGAFQERPAYSWAAETTVYVREDCRRTGVGRRLYEGLEEILRRQGVLNLNACIAAPRGEDPFLTEDSLRFHERMGFSPVGRFHQCGCKFGRWYDMVWMEKFIGAHLSPQPPVKPFSPEFFPE